MLRWLACVLLLGCVQQAQTPAPPPEPPPIPTAVVHDAGWNLPLDGTARGLQDWRLFELSRAAAYLVSVDFSRLALWVPSSDSFVELGDGTLEHFDHRWLIRRRAGDRWHLCDVDAVRQQLRVRYVSREGHEDLWVAGARGDSAIVISRHRTATVSVVATVAPGDVTERVVDLEGFLPIPHGDAVRGERVLLVGRDAFASSWPFGVKPSGHHEHAVALLDLDTMSMRELASAAAPWFHHIGGLADFYRALPTVRWGYSDAPRPEHCQTTVDPTTEEVITTGCVY